MTPAWHYTTDRVAIRKVCVGSYENNVFVVACRTTGRSVIVDAAAEADRITAAAAGTSPDAILTTHGHFDHVGAAREVADALDIPFRMHPADTELAALAPDEPLAEESVRVGQITIEAIHTPGHTPGSISLVVGDVVLTGDTLFPGGPGATRGPGSSFDQIVTSIRDRLLTLPPQTIVMPGHGLDTTIGSEAPHLQDWIDRGW